MSLLMVWVTEAFLKDDYVMKALRQPSPTLLEQLDLGWFATLAGFLHPNLIELQHRYYLTTRRRKTGRKWASNLIKQFWIIIHSLWVNR